MTALPPPTPLVLTEVAIPPPFQVAAAVTLLLMTLTMGTGNIQSHRSTIESLESRQTQLVLLKLDRMDNPASIGVIDSEIDKINERLLERTGEYDALMSTPQHRGGTPGSARS